MNISILKEYSKADILRAAAHLVRESAMRQYSAGSPDEIREFLKLKLNAEEREVFAAIYLDSQHQVIDYKEEFFGTVDGAAVYPREIVKSALAHNAAAAIFVHNHPSGSTEPSHADKVITDRLKQALSLIDVRVLDHLIVAGDQMTSFAERGII